MCKVTSRLSPRTICSVIVLFAFLSVARCARGQSDKDLAARAQATALFAKALAVSDLRSPGSPPFEMRATITIDQRFGKPESGSYLLKWASPDQWREEIHFANYTRIRIGGKNQYWQSRTSSYELGPLLQLDQGLNFLKNLHAWSNPIFVADLKTIKLHQQKAHGVKVNCVTLVRRDGEYDSDYCFDPATGTLDSANSVEFSNFISFAGKYFPRNVRTEQQPSATPVTLQVNSISPIANTNSADFRPSSDSTVWPSCDAPDTLPVIKTRVLPVYPIRERTAHVEGAVFFYALIDTDGRVTNLTVLAAPGDSDLVNSATAAVNQWKYAPETCSGTPVPVETLISVVYTLGP